MCYVGPAAGNQDIHEECETLIVGKPFTPNSSASSLLGSSVASTLAKVIPSSCRGPEAFAYSGSNRLQCPHLHAARPSDHSRL